MIFKSYEAYCMENKKELPTIMKLINKIPMTNLLFSFSVGMKIGRASCRERVCYAV